MPSTLPKLSEVHSPRAAMAVALLQSNCPMSVKDYYFFFGRAAFRQWKKEGLLVKWMDGVGQVVKFSDLIAFFEKKMTTLPEEILAKTATIVRDIFTYHGDFLPAITHMGVKP